jgi:hypothetical protein
MMHYLSPFHKDRKHRCRRDYLWRDAMLSLASRGAQEATRPRLERRRIRTTGLDSTTKDQMFV